MGSTTRTRLAVTEGHRLGAWTLGLLAVAGLVAAVLVVSSARAAQPSVGLGTVDNFALLAGSTVTNTGSSTVNGDLGLSPGTAVTGFPPGTVNGTEHVADAVAGQAQSDLTIAYDDAAGRTPAQLVSADLGGLTVTGGIYKSSSSLGLTGTLTLDAQGDANAVFIFQAGSSLTTASGSVVNLINGAQPCNVFWQVGSSATLGTSSVFVGNILALTSISMNNGVVVHGRALARNGAVTLINDTVTSAKCATGGTTPVSTTPGSTTPGSTTPGSTTPVGTTPGGKLAQNGTAIFTTRPRAPAKTVTRFGTSRCVHGFRATVTGLLIRRVVFSLGAQVIATRGKAPFSVFVGPNGGIHRLTAHVVFTDHTRAANLHFRFRACAAAIAPVSTPPGGGGPPGFTG
jgi:hypothetical protein